MQGSAAKLDGVIRSIFAQSYPFIELFLIHSEDDVHFAQIAKDFLEVRSHIPVHVVSTAFPMGTEHDRIRALEQARLGARGRWLVLVDPDVILERLAIETTLEFAGSSEISAISLRPGLRCRSVLQRLLAPSMEYLLQMVRMADRRQDKNKRTGFSSSFLMMNRKAFDVVNRINRMPGILNEAGWSIWSYQVEGLQTFEADGSSCVWRETDVHSWCTRFETERRCGVRSAVFVGGSIIMTLVSMAGLVSGFTTRIEDFTGASIFAFSAVSYALMGISYFLHSRRLRATGWFAPFWFAAHLPAGILTLMAMRHARRAAVSGRDTEIREGSETRSGPS
jgi:hypothetical protein